MPFSIVHLELSNELKNNFKNEVDFIDFIAGSLFVDSAYNLEELLVDINREITHYYKNENYFSFDFSDNFRKDGLNKNNSFFNIGYYSHLILDKLWRDSNFVGDCFLDEEKEKIYQISRFLYAHYDLENFIKKNSKDLITKLYNYKIDKYKIPSIYSEISDEKLNKTFYSILDYMIGEKTFKKVNDSEKYYEYVNGEIKIVDLNMLKKVENMFPLYDYQKLKKDGLNTIKKELDYI